MGVPALLGGVFLGLSLGAFSARREEEPEDEIYVTGTAGFGPGGAGGGTAGFAAGPVGVTGFGAPGGGMVPGGPSVSVPPITTPDGRTFGGESFFGISAPFYFWPRYWPYWYPSTWPYQPMQLVCEREEIEEGRELLTCRRAAAERPVAYSPVTYAYGGPWWF